MDIVDFYPSVSVELFNKAIDFASTHVEISELDKEILRNARQSLLFHEENTWTKKNGLFDITMGAYDGAQITDLVGLFMLDKLNKTFPLITFKLYRDDGLGIHEHMTPRNMENTKKKLHRLFESFGLKITLDPHLSRVDFLDVTMCLHDDSFKPFRKPNDTPTNIHRDSNHPPHVIKNIPAAINKRLSHISSNAELFNQAKPDYEAALKKSGFSPKMKYAPPTDDEQRNSNNRNKKRARKRKIIWYNPTFNLAMKTKFGKEFLKLIDKHFPKNNPLAKIFNRKTIKISFSCSKNIDATISAHNKKVTNPDTAEQQQRCNCRNKANCPIPGKCCSQCIVYKASTNNVNYIGMTEGPFKTRYNNHTHSFREPTKQSSTTLSQFIWDNGLNPQPTINWQILKMCRTYQSGARACDLCVTERLMIMEHIRDPRNINKRSDIGNRCVHMRAHYLHSVRDNPP